MNTEKRIEELEEKVERLIDTIIDTTNVLKDFLPNNSDFYIDIIKERLEEL